VITIPGISDHVRPESVITMLRNTHVSTLAAGAAALKIGETPAESESREQAPGAQRMLQLILVAGLGVIAYILFTVGGSMNLGSIAALKGEEALHLTILRKLAQNTSLDHLNLMYKREVANTYVYPPYHFALALVSRISGLDPIVVYLKFRPAAGLVSLLSMWSLALALFGRRWVADLTLLALLILVLNNAAGQVPGFYWAQLVPLSHLGDFGLGVMLPVMALFIFRYVTGEPGNMFRILAPLMLLVGLLVHTREVLQLLFFLGATAVAYIVVPTTGQRLVAC